MFKTLTIQKGSTKPKLMYSKEGDSLKLKGIDYIEFYVGNVLQAVNFYCTVFGFTPIAYANLETGVRDQVSFVIAQGNIRLVLTGALSSDSSIAEHVKLHGDAVKDIAFTVDDATLAFESAVACGAQPIKEPTVYENQEGRVVAATIAAYGDTVHSFIERNAYHGEFSPIYHPIKNSPLAVSTCLTEVDHIAVIVEQGKLDQWVDFYCLLGFHQIQQEMVSTEYSAMNSKVVQNSTSDVKFTILEPALGKRFSQIDEFLAFYQGAGSQHIAFLSNDIVKTVRAMRANNVEFLATPTIYYEMLKERAFKIDQDLMAALRELEILVDRDEWGYLMQIFTKPIQTRPTFFLEIIQRQGARGFGSGNVKALFEAVEREQLQRGNLDET